MLLSVVTCQSECCVLSEFDFETAGSSVVRCCLFNASICCKILHGCSSMATFRKSPHLPLWRTFKVLLPWALFYEIMVAIKIIVYFSIPTKLHTQWQKSHDEGRMMASHLTSPFSSIFGWTPLMGIPQLPTFHLRLSFCMMFSVRHPEHSLSPYSSISWILMDMK